MKRTFLKLAAAVAVAAVLSGCATGVKYQDMANTIPAVKPNQGRVYFLRSSSMVGAAIQPEIRLDGQVVGESKPGGFFFVDKAPGNYLASTSTETEKTLSFTLAAGETKYVRTSPSFGLLVGRIVVELETPDKAQAELPSLSFTGTPASK
ncbi:DUF2846 domain-containing protein [Rhizobacter sp. Root1221]|uniref:DUF2846 domain-containing protein n=1 Tax=Rhizobacter sp. Root1221 TaxID=1736433 RepID=UPI0006F3DD95|nr:DUF2846 domain-containing protein [Rhizobacter sp. Root1221]KQV96897.1 hypothetical protein ASC87_24550 [Rhizobacter sp. Root1221]